MADPNSETRPAAGAGTSKRTRLLKNALAAGVLVVCAAGWLFIQNSGNSPSVTTQSPQRVPVPTDTSKRSEPGPAVQDATSDRATRTDDAVTADAIQTDPTSEVETATVTSPDQTDGTTVANVARTKDTNKTVPDSATRADQTDATVADSAARPDRTDETEGTATEIARQNDGGKSNSNRADSDVSSSQAESATVIPEEVISPPSFDVVTVTPSGEAVIAGRAEPGAIVIIRDGNKELGRVTADSRGEWVFVPDVLLEEGVAELSLTTTTAEGVEVDSGKILALANLGEDMKPLAVLMSREGNGVTKLLQGPELIDGLVAPGGLSLDILNYDSEGQVDFSGKGQPNSQISAYVDNQLVGITIVMPDGTWQLIPTEELASGLHTLRIDQINISGEVISRLETPFSMATFERPSAGEGLVIVQPGNSLWRIARRLYGQGIRYTMIFGANEDQIRDPALIYPGQIFIVPEEG